MLSLRLRLHTDITEYQCCREKEEHLERMNWNGLFVFSCAVVTTFVGSGVPIFVDATGSQAGLLEPMALVAVANGDIYVTTDCLRVRKVTPAGGANGHGRGCCMS